MKRASDRYDHSNEPGSHNTTPSLLSSFVSARRHVSIRARQGSLRNADSEQACSHSPIRCMHLCMPLFSFPFLLFSFPLRRQRLPPAFFHVSSTSTHRLLPLWRLSPPPRYADYHIHAHVCILHTPVRHKTTCPYAHSISAHWQWRRGTSGRRLGNWGRWMRKPIRLSRSGLLDASNVMSPRSDTSTSFL